MRPQERGYQRLKIALVIGVVGITTLFAMLGSLFSWYGGYADRRFVLVIVISCLVLVGYFSWSFARRTEVLGWVLFCLSIGVSVWLGSDTPNDHIWAEAILYPAYLLAVFSFSALVVNQSPGQIKNAVICVLAGVFAYALLTPSVYLFALFDGVTRLDNFLPWGYVNIRYWSQIASWVLPLLPLALLLSPLCNNRLWRLAALIAAAVWWWLLFMSAARGSTTSIVVAAAFVSFLFGRHANPWLIALGKQVLVGAIAWLVLSVFLPAVFFESPEMRSFGTDASSRIRLWSEAWEMSLANFPFGLGSQSWLTHDIITPAYESGKKLGHPHNMYLMWAAEYGWLAIFGLILVGLGLLRGLLEVRQCISRYDISNGNKNIVIALAASTVAGAVHAGVSAVFIAPASMLIGLVVLSLFRGAINHPVFCGISSGEMRFVSGGLFLRSCIFVLLLAVTSFWNMEVVRYYQAMMHDRPWYGDNVPQSMQPRFWSHGNFPRHPQLMPGVSKEDLGK